MPFFASTFWTPRRPGRSLPAISAAMLWPQPLSALWHCRAPVQSSRVILPTNSSYEARHEPLSRRWPSQIRAPLLSSAASRPACSVDRYSCSTRRSPYWPSQSNSRPSGKRRSCRSSGWLPLTTTLPRSEASWFETAQARRKRSATRPRSSRLVSPPRASSSTTRSGRLSTPWPRPGLPQARVTLF